MRFFALAAAASSLFTSSHAASNPLTSAHAFCGSNAGTREQIARQEHVFQSFVQNHWTTAGNDSLTKRAASIAVYWNLIFDQNNPSDGNYRYVLKNIRRSSLLIRRIIQRSCHLTNYQRCQFLFQIHWS
jgi:hypothetical protein